MVEIKDSVAGFGWLKNPLKSPCLLSKTRPLRVLLWRLGSSACPPNALYWAFEETRFVNNGSWRLGCCLNRTSSKKPVYISQICDFHRSACSLPSNGKLAHRAFLVLCGRCVNWPAFSLSSVCASCRASSCFDISGAGCASIPLPNSLSFSVIFSVVRCCNKCYSWKKFHLLLFSSLSSLMSSSRVMK